MNVASTSTLNPGSLPSASPPPARRRWMRLGARAMCVAAVLTGLIGVLHMPFAGSLLRRISPASVCPIMRGSPAQIDRAHAIGAAAIRASATARAPARPALGFELDKTRKTELAAWSARHDVTCRSIAANENLQRCTSVPARAVGEPDDLGPLEEVTFEFQATGELVNVQTLRRHLTAAQAVRAAVEIERRDAAVLGEPTTLGGEATVAHLERSLLSTYVAVHTFADYRATVTATNLAETGIMVREEYLSAR